MFQCIPCGPPPDHFEFIFWVNYTHFEFIFCSITVHPRSFPNPVSSHLCVSQLSRVEFVHSRSFIHRDIKVSGVLRLRFHTPAPTLASCAAIRNVHCLHPMEFFLRQTVALDKFSSAAFAPDQCHPRCDPGTVSSLPITVRSWTHDHLNTPPNVVPTC